MWTNIWLMLILFHYLIAVSPATLVCSCLSGQTN